MIYNLIRGQQVGASSLTSTQFRYRRPPPIRHLRRKIHGSHPKRHDACTLSLNGVRIPILGVISIAKGVKRSGVGLAVRRRGRRENLENGCYSKGAEAGGGAGNVFSWFTGDWHGKMQEFGDSYSIGIVNPIASAVTLRGTNQGSVLGTCSDIRRLNIVILRASRSGGYRTSRPGAERSAGADDCQSLLDAGARDRQFRCHDGHFSDEQCRRAEISPFQGLRGQERHPRRCSAQAPDLISTITRISPDHLLLASLFNRKRALKSQSIDKGAHASSENRRLSESEHPSARAGPTSVGSY